MSAKSGRDKYARLEQVRQNLIGEAKKSQGKIDDFLKKQKERNGRMMKAAKGKKIDDNEKREMREQKIERAQNHVKSGIRDNEFEARQKYKQQMYDSQNRADKKLNVDRARSAQIFQSNMQRKHV